MPIQVKKEIDFFTIDEQRAFISVVKDYANYPQFRLILETGMRTSELIGLQWKNVDFEKKEIHIRRTLEYRYSLKKWTWGPPKTIERAFLLKIAHMMQLCRRCVKRRE